jgi:hypothetical protein
MDYCSYGCGQVAKYKMKNGKLCCNITQNKCPSIIKKASKSNTGKTRSYETREKISIGNKGKNKGRIPWNKGIKYDSSFKKTFRGLNKLTISKIKKKYPFFSKLEEMRYNPDKPGEKEIQVPCKNHLCENSKEKGGWFTPTYIQLYERIRQLEKDYGNGGCYLYCSGKCKDECPLFNLQSSLLKDREDNLYTDYEYQQFREHVLQRDNYKCQYCGEKAEHVHHERPQKLEPFFALDPDYAWSVCKDCHYKYGHRDECSTGNLAKVKCKEKVV